MRVALLGGVMLALAACQTTGTPSSVPRPVGAPLEAAGQPLAEGELRGQASDREAKINACLVEMGLPPMAEGLGAGTAPMPPEQSRVFAACMARRV